MISEQEGKKNEESNKMGSIGYINTDCTDYYICFYYEYWKNQTI